MPEFLAPIRQFWQRLTLAQRAVIIGLAGLALVGGFVLLAAPKQVAYAVAFSNLTENDAGAIVQELKASNIAYQVSDDGKIVRVPSDKVPDVRLQVAGKGLIKGGVVGFELFDQTNLLGMTDFTQRLNFQRALEGELNRTISGLDTVQRARVHLVLPQPSLFLEKQGQPTASVVVDLRPGAQLNRTQVTGITRLVASSVENMKPENVTLLDMNGNILSAGDEFDSSGVVSASQLETQRTVEKNIQTSVQNMLDQSLGLNRAIVRVKANLNWDKSESTTESFGPNPVTRSTKDTVETFAGTQGAPAGGVPGITSNASGAAGAPAVYSGANGSSPSQYEKRDTTANYEVSKINEKLTRAPGAVQRLSIAVMVDDQVPPDRVDSVRDLVTAAAGIDAARGDQVQVLSVPFDRTFMDQQRRDLLAEEQRQFYLRLVSTLAVVFVVLVIIFFVVRPLLQRVPARITPALAPAGEYPALGGMPMEGLPAGMAYAYPEGMVPAAGMPAGVVVPTGMVPVGVPAAAGIAGVPLAGVGAPGALVGAPVPAAPIERAPLPPMYTGPSPEEERLRLIQARAAEMARRRSIFEDELSGLARNNPGAIADLIRTWMEEEN